MANAPAPDIPISDEQVDGLLETRYGRWLLLITITGLTLGGALLAIDVWIRDNAIVTPLNRYIEVILLFVGVVNGICSVVGQFAKKRSLHKALFLIAVVVSGVLALVITAVVFTGDRPDLSPGEPVSGPLEEGTSTRHIFATDPGDRITLTFSELDGLSAAVSVSQRRGDQSIEFTAPEDRSVDIVKVSKVVTGGTWDVVVTALEGTSGRYTMTYEIDRRSTPLIIDDQSSRLEYVSTSSENGYLISTGEEGLRVLVTVEVMGEGFNPSVIVYEETQAFPPMLPNDHGNPEMALELGAGNTYVLVVGGNKSSGSYTIGFSELSEADPVVTIPPDTSQVEVPDIYGLTESEAYAALTEAGLIGNTVPVCSSTVPSQTLIQAYLTEVDASESVVADAPGAPVEETTVPADSTIHMKISTGISCEPNTPEARYDALIVGSSPIAFWPLATDGSPSPLEMVSGTDSLVSFSDEEPGDLLSSRAFVAESIGLSALDFDVGAQQRLETGFNPFQRLRGSWTIEAWIMTTVANRATVLGGFHDVIPGVGNDQRWYLAVQDGYACSGVGSERQQCTTEVNDGDWHHLAVVYDEETAGLSLLVDGEAAGAYSPQHSTLVDKELAIGSMWVEHLQAWDEYWSGALSRVAVYDRALTSDEVSEHYDTLRG